MSPTSDQGQPSPLSGGCDSKADRASAAAAVADAFRGTLDLFGTGLDLMRQNLRRGHPEASEEEVERLLDAWLVDRPGATFGDGPGRRVDGQIGPA